MTCDINAFLAHDAQYLFFAEDRVLLLGNIDQAVLADIKRTDIHLPDCFPAWLGGTPGHTFFCLFRIAFHDLPAWPIGSQ
jgi:hypothetical protein